MRAAFVLALLVLASLTPGARAVDAHGKWTVLVYLDADNNLEPSGMANMRELEAVGPSDGVRFLVQMDRAPGYDSSDGDWTGAHRYEIVKGHGAADALASPVLEDLGEIDMGVPQTLQDFLAWGVARAPADHYLVILWDHGAAWDGVEQDETSGNTMSLADVHSALSGAAAASGVAKWDLVDMDACLMGAAETAHAIRDDAAIYVASEELVPGLGLPYPTLAQTLDATPTIAPKDLALALLPAYKERYAASSENADSKAVLAAMDLSAEPAFATALATFNAALIAQAGASWPAVVTAARASERFSLPSLEKSEDLDVVDFAQHLAAANVDASLKAAASGVVDAAKPLILGANNAPDHPNAHGISMRFGVPDAGESATAPDAEEATDGSAQASRAIATAASTDKLDPQIAAFDISGADVAKPGAPLQFTATALDAHLLSVNGAITVEKAGAEYILQYIEPVGASGAVTGKSTSFSWNGSGTTLTNGAQSVIAPAYSSGASGGWTLDGSYRPAGAAPAFNASLDFDAAGKLLRAWDVAGEASEITPAKGDAFAPRYLVVSSGAADTDALGDFIVAKAPGKAAWTLGVGSLAPGEYLLSIYTDDLAGNANLSDAKPITVESASAPAVSASPTTSASPTSSGSPTATGSATASPTTGTDATPSEPASRAPGFEPAFALVAVALALLVARFSRR